MYITPPNSASPIPTLISISAMALHRTRRSSASALGVHRPGGTERRATAARCVEAIAGINRDGVAGGDGGGDEGGGGGDEGGGGGVSGVEEAVVAPVPKARDRIFFRAAVERRSDAVAAEAVPEVAARGDAGANSVCRTVAIVFRVRRWSSAVSALWKQARGFGVAAAHDVCCRERAALEMK